MKIHQCEFWDFRRSVAEDSDIFGYEAASIHNLNPTFRGKTEALFKKSTCPRKTALGQMEKDFEKLYVPSIRNIKKFIFNYRNLSIRPILCRVSNHKSKRGSTKEQTTTKDQWKTCARNTVYPEVL
jgi:hypothetical protein